MTTLLVKTDYCKKPIPLRHFDFICYLDGEEEKGFSSYGTGADFETAIEELSAILTESGRFPGGTILEYDCPTCEGTQRVDVQHPLYGSLNCPEPWTTIQCPDCNGNGSVQSTLKDLYKPNE